MALEIRKIGTKEESERKSKRNILILSIVMISILVLSTAGYFSMREDTSISTGSGKIQNVGGYWVINYDGNNIRVTNSPEETKNVSILTFKAIGNYAGKTIYIASDYNDEAYEISSALQGYAERIQSACYGSCDRNLPEKGCNDTMIVITGLNESEDKNGKVYEQDNCVFIKGDLRAVDAFIYQLFDVN